jgi:hypothetical protein
MMTMIIDDAFYLISYLATMIDIYFTLLLFYFYLLMMIDDDIDTGMMDAIYHLLTYYDDFR